MSVTVLLAQNDVQPIARGDENSRLAHAQLRDKARRGGIDVYFAGDSITRRWGTRDAQYRDFLDNWTRNFFGWNAANFGWGGDTLDISGVSPMASWTGSSESNRASPHEQCRWHAASGGGSRGRDSATCEAIPT